MIISRLCILEVQHEFAWAKIEVLEAEFFWGSLKGMLFVGSLFLFYF